MIKITCLGAGGAFSTLQKGGSSAFLVEVGGQRLLFDCGRTIPDAMELYGVPWDSIDGVFISHLHGDHVGGLETILYYHKYISESSTRIKLFLPDDIIKPLWDNVLSGSMAKTTEPQPVTLEYYADIIPVYDLTKHVGFTFGGALFQPRPVDHVRGEWGSIPCYSLRMVYKDKAIYFSGDTIFEDNFNIWNHNDLVFHEVTLFSAWYPQTVHTHASELAGLSSEDLKKTWFYHYGEVPKDISPELQLCKPGQIFEIE